MILRQRIWSHSFEFTLISFIRLKQKKVFFCFPHFWFGKKYLYERTNFPLSTWSSLQLSNNFKWDFHLLLIKVCFAYTSQNSYIQFWKKLIKRTYGTCVSNLCNSKYKKYRIDNMFFSNTKDKCLLPTMVTTGIQGLAFMIKSVIYNF